METLKVGSKTPVNKLAGAIAGSVREDGCVALEVIGAGSINQAVKASIVARGYMAPLGIDLVIIPSFFEVELDGETHTAIKFTLEPRR